MKSALQPVLLLVFGGLLFSFISFVLWIHTNGTQERVTFGSITSIATSSITISNRNKDISLVMLSDSTLVLQGKKSSDLSSFKIGNFVQVVGIPAGNKTLDASLIRVMQRPRAKEKYDQPI